MTPSSLEQLSPETHPLSGNFLYTEIAAFPTSGLSDSRATGTICFTVTPPLKAQGVPGRPRLFEVIQKVKEINSARRYRAPGRKLVGESTSDAELKSNPSLALSYITAMPRMGLYIQYSTRIHMQPIHTATMT